MSKSLLLLGLTVSFLQAQPLQLYSEFQRIDPFGRVVPIDRADTSREILSPMVARNSHTGFHIVVTPPKDKTFTLHVAQNPDGFFTFKLYKELFTKVGEHWIPERVVEVSLPYAGKLPDAESPIEGQSVIVFWLDLKVPATAEVRRTRLEPQLNIGEDWSIYPLEVRVMEPVVPKDVGQPAELTSSEKRSDTGAMLRLRQFVCGEALQPTKPAEPGALAFLLDRAALQDLALARSLFTGTDRVRLIGEVLRLAGATDSKTWCASKTLPPKAEWYLRYRDALLRGKE